MASIFTKIINREIPAYIVAETDQAIAFLDVFPLRKGHTLVIPKKEVDKFYDLPEEDYVAVMKLAKKIAPAIEKSFDCKRVGEAIIGLEVPHAHVHLVPMNEMNDLNFNQEKLKLSSEEMEEIQQKIIAHLG